MTEARKALMIIQLQGSVGGAQKRYLTFFEYLSKQRDDYLLIINRNLYKTYVEKGVLSPSDRIKILEIDQGFRRKQNGSSGNGQDIVVKKKNPKCPEENPA